MDSEMIISSNPHVRRQIQNRIAQRTYRNKKRKNQIAQLSDQPSVQNHIEADSPPESELRMQTTDGFVCDITEPLIERGQHEILLDSTWWTTNPTPKLPITCAEHSTTICDNSTSLAHSQAAFSPVVFSSTAAAQTNELSTEFPTCSSTNEQESSMSSIGLRPLCGERERTDVVTSHFEIEALKKWKTLVHLAVENGNDRIVQILLEQNVDVNELDSLGRTPLHLAARDGNENIVNTLLARCARIDQKDFSGCTALNLAIARKHENIARVLLAHGADANVSDGANRTPVHIAVENGFEAGLRLLLSHGADPSLHIEYW